MKNLSTWLLVMFMAMFWVFRIIVAVCTEFGLDFIGITTLNMQMEVILLFVVLLCMILVIRRNLVGALIYLLSYGMYFGTDLYNTILAISTEGITIPTGTTAIISFLGVLLPIAVMFDMLADKNRKINPKNKETDWFYKNEQYDRKLDERADKNNYRTL